MTTVVRATAALAARPSAEVLILGGGINGLATFRELALQGVDVVLVERADFVSGASAASSHMIHGGIRYLENGEFRLVHEAVTERNALLALAPHYVRPLRTTIPIFSTFSGLLGAPLRFLRHGRGSHRERGALLIKIGLVIYDSFSRGGGRVGRHVFLGRTRSLAELPQLAPALKYTATYWDASAADPERLAIDVLRDGREAGGLRARAANHVAAVGSDNGRVVLRDELSGESFEFAASVVVNTTGPWTDLTNGALGRPTSFMGGTKGSHIVLDHPELLEATAGRELFFENSDGRIVLIHPLHGRVLVGTSDLPHDMTEPAVCTEDEVDYFIGLIGQVLPRIRVDRSHIVYRFSGVRPLPAADDTAPGFVSRDYRVETDRLPGSETPVLSLVGGKWTTFRASGTFLAERALESLGRARRRSTSDVPIGGGRDFPTSSAARAAWIDSREGGVDAGRLGELLDRYGTRADAVIDAIRHDPDDRPLATAPGYSSAELAHLAVAEDVVHLDDLLMRRTSLAFVGAATAECVAEVAAIVGPVLGWAPERAAAERRRALECVNAADPTWSAHESSSVG